jgi:hypothetical protein
LQETIKLNLQKKEKRRNNIDVCTKNQIKNFLDELEQDIRQKELQIKI